MDSVDIRGLSCRCIIGIRARERRVAQRVRLDLKLELDLERAGKSGRIAHTVDYSRASTEIIALLQFRRYTLLEVAAEECTGWLFAAYPMVAAVKLRIEKPQALAGQAESGGVSIARTRPPEVKRQPMGFGFVEPQLQTSEARISLVGLDPSATLTLPALGAKRALILPLSSGLQQGARGLLAHHPSALEADATCTNHDSTLGMLVVCAEREDAS